jgi:hypothetical protein
MDDGRVHVGYRELAERLHVSLAAARKKAKRKAEAGLWRIIPGNHPADRVLIEVPAEDLDVPAPTTERPVRLPVAIGRTTTLQPADNALDRAEELAIFITGLLAAQRRIEELTNQLQDAHAARYETAAQLNARIDALNLDIKAEKNAHLGTASELGQKLRLAHNAHVATANELGEKLRVVQEARSQDAADLGATEARELAFAAELERARREIEQLRRPWWMKLTRR